MVLQSREKSLIFVVFLSFVRSDMTKDDAV